MPIIDGVEKIGITASQLDELVFNTSFGSVDYKSLSPTSHSIFTNQSVAASATITSLGIHTGNNARMKLSFSQTGTSTNCTLNLYDSDHSDLSLASVLTTLTLGTGGEPVKIFIEPSAIPEYSYCKLINNDSAHTAVCTVEITTWV